MSDAAVRKRYDFYGDMLETHHEVGYLLVILAALALYDVLIGSLIVCFPADDVYLVPGVSNCGSADIIWGAPPPVMEAAAPTTDQASATEADVVRVDLEAGERATSASAAAPSGSGTPAARVVR